MESGKNNGFRLERIVQIFFLESIKGHGIVVILQDMGLYWCLKEIGTLIDKIYIKTAYV